MNANANQIKTKNSISLIKPIRQENENTRYLINCEGTHRIFPIGYKSKKRHPFRQFQAIPNQKLIQVIICINKAIVAKMTYKSDLSTWNVSN